MILMSQLVERTLCVSAAFAPTARQLCACVEMGAGMFERPYGDGETIVGYISSGPILETFSDVLPVTFYDEAGNVTSQQEANYDYFIAMASQSGVTVTQPELEALFAQADISNQLPDIVMERQGYQLM